MSLHYAEPVTGGLGMDSENWRAIMTPDGTRVFLGYSMHHGALWHISQPRGQAPIWFPDFLEMLAQCRQHARGQFRLLSPAQGAASSAAESWDGPLAPWARQVLATPAR